MCGTADLVTERSAARGLNATRLVTGGRSQAAALPDALLGAERALAGWRPPAGLHHAALLQVIACAASLPAATMARGAIERAAGIPVDVACASAFRRRAPMLPPGTGIVLLGGSGEMADLHAALRIAAAQRLPLLGIGPLPDLAADQAAALQAHIPGEPSFPAQVHALLRLGIALGEASGRGDAAFREELGWSLASVPVVLAAALAREARLFPLATRLAAAEEVLLLGRGAGAALAQAGALEFTQRTGLQAEGLPAEMIATAQPPRRPLRPGLPVILCAPSDPDFRAALVDARALRARSAHVTVLTDAQGAAAARVIAEEAALEMVALPGMGVAGCLAIAVALRLLALQLAEAQGAAADRPRHPISEEVAEWASAA